MIFSLSDRKLSEDEKDLSEDMAKVSSYAEPKLVIRTNLFL